MPRILRYISVLGLFGLMVAILYGLVWSILEPKDALGLALFCSPVLMWSARLLVAQKTGFLSERLRWPFQATTFDSVLIIWNSTKLRRAEEPKEFRRYFRREMFICLLVWVLTAVWVVPPWLNKITIQFDNPLSEIDSSTFKVLGFGRGFGWKTSAERWQNECLGMAEPAKHCLTAFSKVLLMNPDMQARVMEVLFHGADSWSQPVGSKLLEPQNTVANNLISIISTFNTTESWLYYEQILGLLQCGGPERQSHLKCSDIRLRNAVYLLDQLSEANRDPGVGSYFGIGAILSKSLNHLPTDLHYVLKRISCRYEPVPGTCQQS